VALAHEREVPTTGLPGASGETMDCTFTRRRVVIALAVLVVAGALGGAVAVRLQKKAGDATARAPRRRRRWNSPPRT